MRNPVHAITGSLAAAFLAAIVVACSSMEESPAPATPAPGAGTKTCGCRASTCACSGPSQGTRGEGY